MENNENFVEQTENVEQTTEETVVEPAKVFTQEDMNAAVGKAKARVSAKIRKEYEKEYGDLVDVLEAGTGKRNVGEITDALKQFYASKGVELPEKKHDNRDLEVLARADAEEIISGGYEEVVEEVDRLANKANMTAREKATFKVLADYRANAERGRELAEKGVGEDVYNSKEFISNINFDLISRLALVYNNGKYYAGASIVSHRYSYTEPTISIENSFGYIKVYAGFNFWKNK